MYSYEMIGNSYAGLHVPDSAIYFAKRSYEEAERVGKGYVPGGLLNDLGELYAQLGQDSIAMGIISAGACRILYLILLTLTMPVKIYCGMAELFKKSGQVDSSFYYAAKALVIARQRNLYNYSYDASSIIADYYKANRNMDSAFQYQGIVIAAKDSLFSQNKIKAIQNIEINEQIRQQQIKEEEIKYQE